MMMTSSVLTHLYTEQRQSLRPGLKPAPLDQESNALIIAIHIDGSLSPQFYTGCQDLSLIHDALRSISRSDAFPD